jgi:putative FmdB family regulatory protein
MPLYEYRCSKCHREFEVLQKFSDAPLEVHEGCGGPVERLISAPSFRFKGSGWYVTDYKNGAHKAGANGPEANGPGTKEDAKPADAKADSKPEAASATSETKTESKPAAETAKK